MCFYCYRQDATHAKRKRFVLNVPIYLPNVPTDSDNQAGIPSWSEANRIKRL